MSKYDNELQRCAWCGKVMTYSESELSECTFDYSTDEVIVTLCYIDREFVTTENLAVEGQYAIDKATRDAAFAAYIANAINPELSEDYGYPWY